MLPIALPVALVLGVSALGGQAAVPPAAAQGAAELSAKAADARERAARLADGIELQGGALEAKLDRAGSAAARESELSTTLDAGQERVAELAAALDAAREELQRTRASLRRSTAALADRMVAIYKAGGPDTLGLLLSSDGYDDLATRAKYLERIQAADEALIERVRDLGAELGERLGTVRAARDRQQDHNEELAAAREGIAAVRARAEAQAAALAGAVQSREAALSGLREQIGRWERQLREAEQISAAEAERRVAETVKGWAIPVDIVLCESGGNFDALNPSSGAGGAYQILPSTWKLYGGKGLPHEASPKEQSRIAALIWADSGGSAWVCAG